MYSKQCALKWCLGAGGPLHQVNTLPIVVLYTELDNLLGQDTVATAWLNSLKHATLCGVTHSITQGISHLIITAHLIQVKQLKTASSNWVLTQSNFPTGTLQWCSGHAKCVRPRELHLYPSSGVSNMAQVWQGACRPLSPMPSQLIANSPTVEPDSLLGIGFNGHRWTQCPVACHLI